MVEIEEERSWYVAGKIFGAANVFIIGFTASRFQIERSTRLIAYVDNCGWLDIVGQPEKETAHSKRFFGELMAPFLSEGFFFFPQRVVVVIACPLIDDSRNEVERKWRVHAISSAVPESPEPYQRMRQTEKGVHWLTDRLCVTGDLLIDGCGERL